jgi:hypothetical protein
LKQTGDEPPTMRQLQHQIQAADLPNAVIKNFFAVASPWMQYEAEVTMMFVQRLWNLTPREELNGLSPDEMGERAGHGGPQETMLMEEGMEYVMKKLRGRSERVLERRGAELVVEMMHDWLHKPQRKLDGRTPMDVIAAERTARAARPFSAGSATDEVIN